VKRDVKALVEQMTVREKIGQIIQVYPGRISEEIASNITGPAGYGGDADKELAAVVGSILGMSGAKEVNDLQDYCLDLNRLDIPLIIMNDVIHGYRTIFPSVLGMGCTWDTELARKCAEVAAKESAVSGNHVTFAPMVDIARDARWGRIIETPGEDPYLNSIFAEAFIRGYQGDDVKDKYRIASCVKHFAAYGAAEAGRDYNTTEVSEYSLNEIYLPAYKAAVDAGCKLVMTAFNCLNGVPATGNYWLNRELLRNEWGFDGLLISDCPAVTELIGHGVAEDEKEAAKLALESGVDIEMVSECYKNIPSLVEGGLLDISLVDEAVLRLLELKEALGLFDDPHKDANEEEEKKFHLCKEHRELARKAAADSLVLLKNDGILPLNNNAGMIPPERNDPAKMSGVLIDSDLTVAVIGPHAAESLHLDIWSSCGREEECTALADAIGNYVKLITAPGCLLPNEPVGKKAYDPVDKKKDDELISEAIEVALNADAVVLALGEHPAWSGEGGSRTKLDLPGRQQELAEQISELGKPVISVVFSGRPLCLLDLETCSNAVLQVWFPGTEGGMAVAEVLFGIRNPKGRLTTTFPYTTGQVPIYYNHLPTARPLRREDDPERYISRYMDAPVYPLHPFGYGLTYSNFEYGHAELSNNVLTNGGSITISLTITNTGLREGTETAQLYIRDMVGSYSRPVRELKGFESIDLKPGESRDVFFTITEKMLRYHTRSGYRSEPGAFKACIAPDAASGQWLSFTLA